MTQKVHCRGCSLYLGRSEDLDPPQILCPLCEEYTAQIAALMLNIPEPEYPNWFSEVMRSNAEGRNARYFIQLIMEDRVDKVYDFPHANGAIT